MPRSDLTHARGRARDEGGWLGRALAALLVVALVAGGVVAWRLDLLGRAPRLRRRPAARRGPGRRCRRRRGWSCPRSPTRRRSTPPCSRPARSTARSCGPPWRRTSRTRRSAATSSALVADLSAGGPVVELGDGAAAIPASTTKLLTTTAALSVLGPETRFATRVLTVGKNRLVLVGGGDPFLSSRAAARARTPPAPTSSTLAAADRGRAARRRGGRGAARLRRLAVLRAVVQPEVARVRTCPRTSSRASPRSGSTRATPRRARVRADDPSLAAAQAFAAALTEAGIRVVGDPTRGVGQRRRRADAVSSPRRCARSPPGCSRSATTRRPRCSRTRSGSRSRAPRRFADGAAAVIQTLPGSACRWTGCRSTTAAGSPART